MFDGGGFQVEQFDRGLHGLGDGRKENQVPRLWLLGSGTIFSSAEIMAASVPSLPAKRWLRLLGIAQKTLQAVTRPAFQQAGRKLFVDRRRRVSRTSLASSSRCAPQRIAVRAGALDAAIGQHDFEREHMVRGDAVKGNVRAGGIVGDHAAERRARTGGDIRAETKTVRLEESVELIQHHARADAHGAAFQVEFAIWRLWREKSMTRPSPMAPPTKPVPAPRGMTGTAGIRRGADDGTGLPGIARKGHGERLDLIKRGVGGVKLARQVVERDITIRCGQGRMLLGRNHADNFGEV